MPPPEIEKIKPPAAPQPPSKPAPAHVQPAPPKPALNPVAAPVPLAAGPFTTNTTDQTELAKLPRQPTDLADASARAKLERLTSNALAWFKDAPQPSQGNTVVPYVYGRFAFSEMAEALATAYSAEHRIYILGWWAEPWTKMKNPPSGSPPANTLLQDYLRNSKAHIRALFWNSPLKKKPGDNEAIQKFIDSLPNGASIEDAKMPQGNPPLRGPGAHHQKMLVVSGGEGLMAFIGGMDLNNSRVDVGGFNPLHDVHVRITGPAAAECLRIFKDRWLDHPDALALDKKKFNFAAPDVEKDFDNVMKSSVKHYQTETVQDGKARNVNMFVAVGRTFAKLSKFNSGQHYSFAKSGDQSAWQLVKSGIANAKKFIYVEDQYFVSRRAKTELLKKLKEPEFQFLLILMGNSLHFESDPDITKDEFPYLISARNEIRTDLATIDPGQKKWRMFSLKTTTDPARREWCGDFVHPKLWIFDDDHVVVGSANCDDRGYTYDTEIMAGITETPLERARGLRFARELRIALWHKHLGIPHSQLQDFTKGLNHWLKLPTTAMVYDASAKENSPLLGDKLLRDTSTEEFMWSHLIDPDADKLPAQP